MESKENARPKPHREAPRDAPREANPEPPQARKPAPAPASPDPAPTHEPAPVDLASESAAGEEDPGASIDLAVTPPARPPAAPKR